MNHRVLCLIVGDTPFVVLPDGRGIVELPTSRLPFGAAVTGTAVYASLQAFLERHRRRS